MFTRKQLVFGHSDLSVNHAVQVQLTAVSKGKVFAEFARALGYEEFSTVGVKFGLMLPP